jgi:uncharacterized 2Fe-2S/4Fe-4S cluster protein (DUF4445 family)
LTGMARVQFLPDNITIEVEEGLTILDAARRAGMEIESPCNGAGTCGKCGVVLNHDSIKNVAGPVEDGPYSEDGERVTMRACATGIRGDVTVLVTPADRGETLRILSHGNDIEIGRNPYKTFARQNTPISLVTN